MKLRALLEEDGRFGIWHEDKWLFSISTRDEKIVADAVEAFQRGRRIGKESERQRVKGLMMESLEGLKSPMASIERRQIAGRIQQVVDRICPEEG